MLDESFRDVYTKFKLHFYQEVLRKRKEVYEKAKERHPERWAKGTRAWSFQKKNG